MNKGFLLSSSLFGIVTFYVWYQFCVVYRPLLPAAITVSSFHFNLLLTFHQVKGSCFDTVSVCLVTTHSPAVSWFCLHLAWVSSDLCSPPTRHRLYDLCTWTVTDDNLYRWTSPDQRWSLISDLSAFPSSFLPDIVITTVVYWLMYSVFVMKQTTPLRRLQLYDINVLVYEGFIQRSSDRDFRCVQWLSSFFVFLCLLNSVSLALGSESIYNLTDDYYYWVSYCCCRHPKIC